ncbi:MAG: DUF6438 domain-containing protein [Saprospiraceae bacterium]
MRHLFFLFLLASAWQCKSHKDGQPSATAKLVALETFPCRGYCPVYQLTFYQNGLLEYNGEKFVEKTGPASTMLGAEELAEIRQEVAKTNLWQYPQEVETQVMDAPYATLTTWNGDQIKSVRGSIDRPKPLLELEKLLKNTAEAHGIKVINGVNPNMPAVDANEVIVQLKTEINAGNWIARFEEIKLRLVRRLYDNTWLISYDPEQISEQQVMELLKSTDGALDVQPNHPVQDRH